MDTSVEPEIALLCRYSCHSNSSIACPHLPITSEHLHILSHSKEIGSGEFPRDFDTVVATIISLNKTNSLVFSHLFWCLLSQQSRENVILLKPISWTNCVWSIKKTFEAFAAHEESEIIHLCLGLVDVLFHTFCHFRRIDTSHDLARPKNFSSGMLVYHKNVQ